MQYKIIGTKLHEWKTNFRDAKRFWCKCQLVAEMVIIKSNQVFSCTRRASFTIKLIARNYVSKFILNKIFWDLTGKHWRQTVLGDLAENQQINFKLILKNVSILLILA